MELYRTLCVSLVLDEVIQAWRNPKMISTVIIVLLILFLLGALPSWNHSRNWGYVPSGGVGLILTIVVILWLLGKI
jgi:hypothetical protein